MKKGCFLGLLTWAGCGGGYWYFLHTRFLPPLDWAIPLAAGFLMAVVVGNFRIGLDSAISAIRVGQQSTFTGVTGERPPDGHVVTVPGRIRASGASLQAPLTGRSAVLYSYDINRIVQGRNGLQVTRFYSGYGLTPAVIDSSYGPIRLLGFPTLEGFTGNVPDSSPARAREYVAGAEFTDLSGFDAPAMFREMKELMTDDDGQLRKDWRMSKEEMPDDVSLLEQVIAPGEQVTAIGLYSAAKGGLVPNLSNPLRLVHGDPHTASSSLWRKAGGTIISSLFFAAVVNGLLFGALYFFGDTPIGIPRSRNQQRMEADALHNASRNGDIPAMELAIGRGAPVDARDAERATPLMRATDARTASWLIAHGADVNAANEAGETALMEHAHLGRADVVAVLLKSKPHLDTVSRKWKTTALQQALDAERLDVAQLLRDAGAHDVTVTGKNGHAIDKDSEPVRAALVFLDAIQREDLTTLNARSARGPYKNVDWKAWKESRPINPRLVSGFASDQAATIALRGRRTDGIYETWTFQLVPTQAAGWRITDERWETRFDGKEP